MEKVVRAWLVNNCVIPSLVVCCDGYKKWVFVFLFFFKFSLLFFLPLLAVRVNLYLLATLGRWERCQKEDVKCILKWAVRNWFDISDKGKGYCTQLFSSYLLIPFLVNHNWRREIPHHDCLVLFAQNIWQLGFTWHQPHCPGCVWCLGTSPLSVPWALGELAARVRGNPGLSPHCVFPYCRNKKCLLLPSCILQRDLELCGVTSYRNLRSQIGSYLHNLMNLYF